MQHKTCSASFKLTGEPGEFRAIFSRFNVVDKDNDVTPAGAFSEGAPVRIAAWGHNWQVPAVGKGEIHSDREKAWVDGQLFLENQAGREHYETIKGLGLLQEWSYGYSVLDSAPGTFQGQKVRFLKRLEVQE